MTTTRNQFFKIFANLFLVLCLSSCTAHTFENSGQYVDDSIITTKVKYKLSHNTTLNPFKIKVSSSGGNVVLTGLLDTRKQYNNAVAATRSVKGVKSVNTVNLKVKMSTHPARDVLTTSKVKAKLVKAQIFSQKESNNWPVKVTTKNGRVFLSGKVNSYATKHNVIKSVQQVSSVKSIDSSQLKVG